MLRETGINSGPLQQRIKRGLGQLIDNGVLLPRSVLPSERDLAAALSVSRTTVAAAYRALHDDGQLDRREGSGTRVRGLEGATPSTSGAPPAPGSGNAEFLTGSLATLDLSSAGLPALPLAAEVAASLDRSDYDKLLGHYHGYHPQGIPALRARLAQMYTETGLGTTPDQIVITAGAQQAIELVLKGYVQAGDPVAIEQPCYRGAIEALAGLGARVSGVPCDGQGIDVDRLEFLLAGSPQRLLCLQSAVQNPTGATLSPERRQRLSRLCRAHSVVVIDDTTLAGTSFDDTAPTVRVPPELEDNWITVGSMSKLFWAGLRLGWIRASARVASRLTQLRGHGDYGTSVVSQQIGLRLLDHVDEAREIRRRQLQRGLADVEGLLGELLPDWTWQRPRGGPSLWARLPEGDSTRLVPVALRFGLAVLPGAAFSANGATDDHLRLPYTMPTDVLADGVRRLAQAWHAYRQFGDGMPIRTVRT